MHRRKQGWNSAASTYQHCRDWMRMFFINFSMHLHLKWHKHMQTTKISVLLHMEILPQSVNSAINSSCPLRPIKKYQRVCNGVQTGRKPTLYRKFSPVYCAKLGSVTCIASKSMTVVAYCLNTWNLAPNLKVLFCFRHPWWRVKNCVDKDP